VLFNFQPELADSQSVWLSRPSRSVSSPDLPLSLPRPSSLLHASRFLSKRQHLRIRTARSLCKRKHFRRLRPDRRHLPHDRYFPADRNQLADRGPPSLYQLHP
jgi:hypothetical protein